MVILRNIFHLTIVSNTGVSYHFFKRIDDIIVEISIVTTPWMRTIKNIAFHRQMRPSRVRRISLFGKIGIHP